RHVLANGKSGSREKGVRDRLPEVFLARATQDTVADAGSDYVCPGRRLCGGRPGLSDNRRVHALEEHEPGGSRYVPAEGDVSAEREASAGPFEESRRRPARRQERHA